MSIPGSSFPFAESQREVLRPVPRAILTREGEQVLREELERLRQQLDVEVVERLRAARDSGAPSENDEYLQIKEEEAVIRSRLHQLEALLHSAEIVDEGGAGPDMVAIGSRVEVENLTSGSVGKHRITGGFGPFEPTDISVNSPVGQALVGLAPGQEVSIELPGGRSIELRVRAIESRRPTAPLGRA